MNKRVESFLERSHGREYDLEEGRERTRIERFVCAEYLREPGEPSYYAFQTRVDAEILLKESLEVSPQYPWRVTEDVTRGKTTFMVVATLGYFYEGDA